MLGSTADIDMAQAMADNRRYQMDETLFVRFYEETMQDEAASEREGRPIFSDVEMVEIMQPGNKDSIIRRRAYPVDKERFARHYQAYKARKAGSEDEHMEGTPLKEWAGITRSQAEELAFFHCHTVEQLANITDANTQNMLGIQSLKQKAKEWLEVAEGKRLKDAEAEIAELKAMVAELAAAKAEEPKKRGRPRKQEVAEASEE